MKCGNFEAHLLKVFSQNVGSLLLVDEDDDWRLDSAVEDLDQLVAFVVLLHQEDCLLDTLDRLADGSDVNDGWTTQIRPEMIESKNKLADLKIGTINNIKKYALKYIQVVTQ